MTTDVEKHLSQLRSRLLKRTAERQAQLRASRKRRAAARKAATSGAASHAVEDAAVDEAALDDLWLCESALRRIETGTYGTCRDCLGPIGVPRLLVRPQAERCDACDTLHAMSSPTGAVDAPSRIGAADRS